jgi:hypothetical protein
MSLTTQYDLRELRTTFLDKRTTYALSFSYGPAACVAFKPARERSALRSDSSQLKDSAVFDVLGNDRVPGLDGRGHDTPVGFKVCGLSEAVNWHWRDTPNGLQELWSGTLEGRMVFESPHDDESQRIRIAVTYQGTLQLVDSVRAGNEQAIPTSLEANAFITTFFETDHPRYHWLSQSASLGFGKWAKATDRVSASFDVYSVF